MTTCSLVISLEYATVHNTAGKTVESLFPSILRKGVIGACEMFEWVHFYSMGQPV